MIQSLSDLKNKLKYNIVSFHGKCKIMIHDNFFHPLVLLFLSQCTYTTISKFGRTWSKYFLQFKTVLTVIKMSRLLLKCMIQKATWK